LRADGKLDPSFHTIALDSYTDALLLLSTGKILAAGSFARVNNASCTGLVRINSDGTLDTSYKPPAGAGGIRALATNSLGGLLFGGGFDTLDGTPRPGIAQFTSGGTLDTGFNPPPTDGTIYSLLVQDDGRVLIYGSFNQVANSARKHLARLNADGSLDTEFVVDPASYDYFDDVALSPDGKVFIAVHQNGTDSVFRLQSGASAFGPPVFSSAPTNVLSKLGETVDLQIPVRSFPPATYQWMFNGAFVPGQTNSSLRLTNVGYAAMGSYVLAASNTFGVVYSDPIQLIVNASPIMPGSVDASFDPGAGFGGGHVTSIAQQGDNIIAGGTFNTFRGNPALRIARLYSDGRFDSSFATAVGPTADVQDLAVDSSGHVLIGSRYSGSFGAAKVGALLRLDLSGNLDAYTPALPRAAQVWALLPLPGGECFVLGDCLDLSCSEQIVRLQADGTPSPGFNQSGLQLIPNRWLRVCGLQNPSCRGTGSSCEFQRCPAALII